MMQMEDLLAACLDAQDQGCSPVEILESRATFDQRTELESLLALAGRLRHLAPPPLGREAREAMAARLAITRQLHVASPVARTWA